MASTPQNAFVGKFGERVAWRRQMVGLTQKEVAARLGLNRTHLVQVEKGRYLSLRLEVLAGLARLLKTSTDFLLGLSDDPGEIVPPGPCPGEASCLHSSAPPLHTPTALERRRQEVCTV